MTLERDLRALADGFPEAPQLAPRVLASVQGAAARRRRRRRFAVLALALVLLAPATALAVSPDLRNRVLETFGLRHVKVERVVTLPAVSPEAAALDLGTRISLAEARTSLQLRVNPPSALGAPNALFEELLQGGVAVTLLYEPRTVAARIGVRERVLVTVVRGTLDKQLLGKTLGFASDVEQFEIDGGRALLLTGPAHMVVFFRRGPNAIDSTRTRLAGTTLLWQRRAMLLRIEGELPKARLVAIARSFSTG